MEIPNPTHGKWVPGVWPFLNPEGVSSLSPGLLYSATLGIGRRAAPPNPNGVADRVGKRGEGDRSRLLPPVASSHNPVGVGQGASTVSQGRVAEYGNPGLNDETPLGFKNGQTPATHCRGVGLGKGGGRLAVVG